MARPKFLAVAGGVFQELTGEALPDDVNPVKQNAALDSKGFDPASVIVIIEAVGALLMSLLDKCGEWNFPFREPAPVLSDDDGNDFVPVPAFASKAEEDTEKLLATAELARKPIRGLRVRIGLRARAADELAAAGYAEDERVNRVALADAVLRYAQPKNRKAIAEGLAEEYAPQNSWW